MNLVANNLLISCLTTITYFGFNLYLAWCTNGIVLSNSILCCVNYGGIPFISLYGHAKTYLNSLNSCSNFNTLHVSNCALFCAICGFTSIPRLSFINCWSSVNIHPSICNSYALIFVGVSSTVTFLGWWLWYVSRYTLSSRSTSSSYLLPAIFFFVLYTSNSYIKIIVFTFVFVISTFVVFID